MNQSAILQLRSGTLHAGTWLSIGSPVASELAASFGFDWLLLDLEHGCGGEASLFPNLQAARGTTAALIVRVGAPAPDLILRALDWGADGIMVPHVCTAAEAEECLQAIHYAPRGKRGFSRSARTYGYGLQPPSENPMEQGPLFFAQIENLEGVENAEAIARVNGVDVLFVGPADLNFELKARRSKKAYSECLQKVITAAKIANKQAGILIREKKDMPELRAMGFTCMAIDSDLSMLREGYRQALSSFTR